MHAGDDLPPEYVEVAGRLASLVGGTVLPMPHVTVAAFNGSAEPEDVAERARQLHGPPVEVRGSELCFHSGSSINLRVARTDALRAWHDAAVLSLEPLGLVAVRAWDEMDPHITLVGGLDGHAGVFLERIPHTDWSVSFTATNLTVSRRVDDRFALCLRRALP